jgi:putative DNA primase/helicase
VDGPVVVNMAAAAPTTRDVEASFTVDAQASPPEDKLAALLSRPTAAASWNHAREDLADQSPSSYDLSLASMAVAAGWDDQDIVDLLIACRRHNQSPPKLRTDYLVRTLAKARSSPEPGNGDGDDGDDTLGKHIKQHGLIPVLADLLEDDTHFAGDDGGGLYRFTGGRYEPAHRWLGREARQQLEDGMATKHWRASAGKDLAHYIWLVAPRLWDQPPADVLNVQNGLLDIASGRLREHDPRHLSTVQLPVRYDPDATCPHIDQFVRDTFPEDAFDLAAQMIAFVMLPDPSIQKAILLIGSGGNGKSVWLRVVQRFLGSENYSTESLQRLEGNRFAVSSLQGKLANICADLPATDLKGSSVFKSVTGNDRLIAERKYHDAYDLSPYCKLIFSANNPPRTPDASEAFFQRWLVINFSRTFRGEAIEVSSRELDARLHDPVELSGLLNRALAALPRLRANGFSEPLSCLMARDAFRAATDPVSVWIDQSTRSVPGAYITKAQLLEEYNAAAITSGNPTMTANAFGRSLRHNRPNLRSGQRRLADRMTDVWLDVTLRTDQTAHSGDSGNHTTGMNWGS